MTEENQEFKVQIIETIDENGNAVELELLDIVDVEGVEYAVLKAVDDEPQNDEEVDAVLMRLVRDGDNFSFEEIDNDEEFNIVAEYIEGLDDEE